MLLYHFSRYTNFSGQFVPKIPYEPADNENVTIKRISAAPTLEQCLASVGCCEGVYRLFKVDTDKLNINAKSIVTPQELDERGQVFDALFYKEHWITVPFTVPEEDQLLIEVESWEEDYVSLVKETNQYVPYQEGTELSSGIVIYNLKYKVNTKEPCILSYEI